MAEYSPRISNEVLPSPCAWGVFCHGGCAMWQNTPRNSPPPYALPRQTLTPSPANPVLVSPAHPGFHHLRQVPCRLLRNGLGTRDLPQGDEPVPVLLFQV